MKLHQRFITSFLPIFILAIFLSAMVSYSTIKETSLKQHKEFLKNQAELIKLKLPMITGSIDEFTKEVKAKTGIRLTVITKDGVVIAESDYDKKKMDNHRDREEIELARHRQDGYAVRYSDTLDAKFLYFASRSYFRDKAVFVRVAMDVDSIVNGFSQMWTKLTVLFVALISLGIYIAYRLNQKIEKEITKITNVLDDISSKNYKTSVNASFAKEFLKIESHIEKLTKILEKSTKQKRKYTAKIKLISTQRSNIISAISHEFKNPIASVIGYAQTLLDDPNVNKKIREKFLEKIVKNSFKISNMIDRLSLTTKFENGDLSPKITEFDIDSLTKEIIVNFQDKHDDRAFIYKSEKLMVKADKTMMELVITNLIDNAVKYSQSDININIKDGLLSVKDRGIGIEKKEIDKITNKFYRSDSLSWDNSMGLGLALVKYILNLHNISLEIKSELGVGSEFSFNLKYGFK